MIATDRWHARVIRDPHLGPSPLRVAAVILHRLAPDDDGLVATAAELAEAANISQAVAVRSLWRLRARGWIALPPMTSRISRLDSKPITFRITDQAPSSSRRGEEVRAAV